MRDAFSGPEVPTEPGTDRRPRYSPAMPKAWRVHEYGHYREKLRWEDIDAPEPPDGGAVIKVLAAGVNFPDLLAIAGKYQVKAPLPFTPGLEACGEVSRCRCSSIASARSSRSAKAAG